MRSKISNLGPFLFVPKIFVFLNFADTATTVNFSNIEDKSEILTDWDSVSQSVISDGVLLIHDDGTYADGYSDFVVNKKTRQTKISWAEMRKKPSVASHVQQKLIKIQPRIKQYLENIPVVWYLILRMILTTIWNVLIFFVSAKNKFITIDLVTETFSLFDIIMLFSSIKDNSKVLFVRLCHIIDFSNI